MVDQFSVYAAAEMRQRRLLDKLNSAPIVDVYGVVAPPGASGNRYRGEKLWTLKFTFDAWRVGTGAMQTRPLTVRRQVTDEELHRLRILFTSYTIAQIRARVVCEPLPGTAESVLESFEELVVSDTELTAYVDKKQAPSMHTDPVFGVFKLDQNINWFVAKTSWDGAPVTLNLSADDPRDVQAALKTAHALWQKQSEWNKRIRDYAADRLLPIKNESWLETGETEMSSDAFKSRMTLKSVTVCSDGSFDFWHNDGGLFWGHAIEVFGNVSTGPLRADIPG